MRHIQVRVTNNAGGADLVTHDYQDLLQAHLHAERVNLWPSNQIRGSSAVVLVDGVQQMGRLDQWYRDEIQARRCGVDLPAMTDSYQPRVIAEVE